MSKKKIPITNDQAARLLDDVVRDAEDAGAEKHLDDGTIIRAATGGPLAPAEADHLASCELCAGARDELRSADDAWSSDIGRGRLSRLAKLAARAVMEELRRADQPAEEVAAAAESRGAHAGVEERSITLDGPGVTAEVRRESNGDLVCVASSTDAALTGARVRLHLGPAHWDLVLRTLRRGQLAAELRIPRAAQPTTLEPQRLEVLRTD